MTVKEISDGDKSKQGNATCPKCGAIVLITDHYGDTPSCPNCNLPYTYTPMPTQYE